MSVGIFYIPLIGIPRRTEVLTLRRVELQPLQPYPLDKLCFVPYLLHICYMYTVYIFIYIQIAWLLLYKYSIIDTLLHTGDLGPTTGKFALWIDSHNSV